MSRDESEKKGLAAFCRQDQRLEVLDRPNESLSSLLHSSWDVACRSVSWRIGISAVPTWTEKTAPTGGLNMLRGDSGRVRGFSRGNVLFAPAMNAGSFPVTP